MLGTGIVEGLVGAGILFAGQKAVRYVVNTRPGRRLWRVNEAERMTIIISSGPHYDASEYTETVFPTEARPAAEVESYVRRLYPKLSVRVRTSSSVHADDLRGNLVVIGGPDHNRIARSLLGRIEVANEWSFDGYSLIFDGQRYEPVMSEDEDLQIAEDIGVLYRGRNPYAPDCLLFLLVGCRTFGPLAAARATVRSSAERGQWPTAPSFSAAFRSYVHGDDVLAPVLLAPPVVHAASAGRGLERT
jgi:hypothetical protein